MLLRLPVLALALGGIANAVVLCLVRLRLEHHRIVPLSMRELRLPAGRAVAALQADGQQRRERWPRQRQVRSLTLRFHACPTRSGLQGQLKQPVRRGQFRIAVAEAGAMRSPAWTAGTQSGGWRGSTEQERRNPAGSFERTEDEIS